MRSKGLEMLRSEALSIAWTICHRLEAWPRPTIWLSAGAHARAANGRRLASPSPIPIPIPNCVSLDRLATKSTLCLR